MSSGLIDAFRLFYHRKFHTIEQTRSYQEKQLRRLIDLSVKESSFYRDRFSPQYSSHTRGSLFRFADQ